MPTPINTPSADLLSITSASAAVALGNVALAGTSKAPSASDHVHQIPALTGDVTKLAGVQDTVVAKIRGKTVSDSAPASGNILQWDGSQIVWGNAPAGGSGGGGIVMFFNNGTTGDNPLTGLPALTNSVVYKEFKRTAETNQTTLTSASLTASYTNIAGFITDVNDPETVEITAGLWDFNLWALSSNGGTLVRASLYKYDGGVGSSSLLATSAAVTVPTIAEQLLFSLIIPQTTIALTDRIVVVFEALNPGNNHTVTLQFGGATPSHTHTTLPSVGKTGVVKVINGVTQTDASKIVNADIDENAAIDQSKISGTISVLKGGTGQSSYVDGQLLIGNSTGNTLTKSTLTAGAGITVTNGSGAVTLSAKGFGTNTKIVGVDALTIQGCIDLCTSASQSNTYSVLIPPKGGDYVENLTLKGSVSLIGLTAGIAPDLIQINGSHTYAPSLPSPNANRLGFQNLTFTSASGNANTITVLPTVENPYAYASQLRFSFCVFSGNKNNTFSQISTCDNVSLYIDNCRFESAGGGATSAGVTQGNGPLYLSNNTIFNVFGRALDVPASTTTTRTATSTLTSTTLTLTVGNTTGLVVGQKISGTGIAAGTIIVSLTAPNIVVMSTPSEASTVGLTATFGNAPYVEIHDSILQGAGNEVVRLGNGLLTCSTSNFTNTVGSGINMLTANTVVGIINSSFAISNTAAFTITAVTAPCYAALNAVSYSSSALRAYSTLIGASVVVLDYAARATPISNGGTGATTQQAAITALAGAQTNGMYLRSNGTNTSLSAIVAVDVPTLNQSTTGTAANVSGIVAIANGGTGATSKSAAFNALSPIAAAGDLIIGNGVSSATALTIGTTGKVLTSNGTTATWETPAAGGGVTTIANGGTGVTTVEEAKGVMGGIQTAIVRHTANIVPASAGTMTNATWTSGSAIVTFTSTTATLVPGMSMNGSGLTANVIKTVDSPTQVTMSANSTSSGGPLGLTVYNSTRTSMVTSTAPTMDGRTVIAGDVIFLANQSVSSTAGPWAVVSNSGSSLSLIRPAWFQGSLTQPILIGLQQGSSGGGFVYTVGAQFGAIGPLSIGIDPIISTITSSRTHNAITGSNTFSSAQTLAVGGASGTCPLIIPAGVLNTTAVANRFEWDGNTFYATNAASIRKKFSYLEDGVTISATAPSAVVFDIESSEVVYHTANTTADFTLNLRGSSTLTVNSILEVNKARTVVLMVTNGETAYKVTTVSVDGVAQTVKWLGGAAISGNSNSIDSYSITIIKTAANTYTVLGSAAKFA